MVIADARVAGCHVVDVRRFKNRLELLFGNGVRHAVPIQTHINPIGDGHTCASTIGSWRVDGSVPVRSSETWAHESKHGQTIETQKPRALRARGFEDAVS